MKTVSLFSGMKKDLKNKMLDIDTTSRNLKQAPSSKASLAKKPQNKVGQAMPMLLSSSQR
jgi:hypothetical protein